MLLRKELACLCTQKRMSVRVFYMVYDCLSVRHVCSYVRACLCTKRQCVFFYMVNDCLSVRYVCVLCSCVNACA